MIAAWRLAGRLGKRGRIAHAIMEIQPMPKSNIVPIRDERGRFLRGMPPGPGRPLGSRNKLREDFFADMHTAWLERGPEVING